MTGQEAMLVQRLVRRRRQGWLFAGLFLTLTLVGVAVLGILLVQIIAQGGQWLTLEFLRYFPSRLQPERSGLKSALWGSVWLMVLTGVFSVPVGVASAVYLHEYAKRSRWTHWIEVNIANLAGVPSIVYGILGLGVFTRLCHLGRSVLAGALTLSLLVLPVVIIASREALAAVPDSLRQAAYALGATRWQAVRSHVLPAALPGILTGVILALSRAIGEAAPLIVIGALTFIPFVPSSPLDRFTALPVQIFTWCDEPDPIFQELAAAGILVLLGLLIPMNAVALGIRWWHQKTRTS